MLVLGGNGHKLNASLIDYETETETPLDLGAKVPMPVLGDLMSRATNMISLVLPTGSNSVFVF